jgi:predicted enzyme related to lactoylglutathione lyase
MHPTFGNGKICYIEIPASDIAKSSDFYERVFQWSVRRRGDGSVAFDDGVGEVSGTWVLGRKPLETGTLTVHIMVDDIEEAIRKVIETGGELVQAVGADLPELTAKIRDPGGNVIGLYQHGGSRKAPTQ